MDFTKYIQENTVTIAVTVFVILCTYYLSKNYYKIAIKFREFSAYFGKKKKPESHPAPHSFNVISSYELNNSALNNEINVNNNKNRTTITKKNVDYVDDPKIITKDKPK